MGSKLRRLRVQVGATTKRYQRAHGHPAARPRLEFQDGNVIVATGKPERGFVSVVGSASEREGIEVAVAPSGDITPETKADIATALTEAVEAQVGPAQVLDRPKTRRSAALLATVATLAMLADLPGRGSR